MEEMEEIDLYFGELFLMNSLCVWNPHCYLEKLLSELFFFIKGNFLSRTVYTNHEISTRKSKFKVYFEKHDMVFQGSIFNILRLIDS